jgi:hypothetical protein
MNRTSTILITTDRTSTNYSIKKNRTPRLLINRDSIKTAAKKELEQVKNTKTAKTGIKKAPNGAK